MKIAHVESCPDLNTQHRSLPTHLGRPLSNLTIAPFLWPGFELTTFRVRGQSYTTRPRQLVLFARAKQLRSLSYASARDYNAYRRNAAALAASEVRHRVYALWRPPQQLGLPRWHNRLARRTYSQYLLAMSHAEVVSSSLTRGTVLRPVCSCETPFRGPQISHNCASRAEARRLLEIAAHPPDSKGLGLVRDLNPGPLAP